MPRNIGKTFGRRCTSIVATTRSFVPLMLRMFFRSDVMALHRLLIIWCDPGRSFHSHPALERVSCRPGTAISRPMLSHTFDFLIHTPVRHSVLNPGSIHVHGGPNAGKVPIRNRVSKHCVSKTTPIYVRSSPLAERYIHVHWESRSIAIRW